MKIERIKNIIKVSEEIGSDIAKIVAYDKIKEIINENDRGFTVEAIPSAKHEDTSHKGSCSTMDS